MSQFPKYGDIEAVVTFVGAAICGAIVLRGLLGDSVHKHVQRPAGAKRPGAHVG